MEAFCARGREYWQSWLHFRGVGGTQCNLGGALLNPEHIWRKLAWMGRVLEFMGQDWCTGAVNGRSTGGWQREQGKPDRLHSRSCTDQGEQLPQGNPHHHQGEGCPHASTQPCTTLPDLWLLGGTVSQIKEGLCDIRWITQPSVASVSSSIEWGIIIAFTS